MEVGRHCLQRGHRRLPHVGGIDLFGGPAGDRRLGRGGALGCRAQPEQADGAPPDAVVVVELDGDRRSGDGEVAVTPGELLDRRTRSGRSRPGTSPR